MDVNQTHRDQSQLLWGYRYQLCEKWAEYYAWGGAYRNYCYAEPTRDANGHTSGEVWICDAKGRRHPRFGWHPIHHKRSSLHTPEKIQAPSARLQAMIYAGCEIWLSCQMQGRYHPFMSSS